MRDGIVIQQAYTFYYWDDYRPQLHLTKARHLEYCNKHDLDYMCVFGNVRKDWKPLCGGWAKVELIRQALTDGYKYVCWIDSDAMIADMDADLREGCPEGIGMVVHSGSCVPAPHYNVGIMLIRNSKRVLEFVTEWARRYPGTTEFPWYEQGEINKMSVLSEWKGIVHDIPAIYNSCRAGGTEVIEPVITAWHGMGNGLERLAQMKDYLDKLNASPS